MTQPPLAHDDANYYAEVLDQMRTIVATNKQDVGKTWSDSDKLRYLALCLDNGDLSRGVTDQHDIQNDLRRIADKLEATP